MVDLVAEHSADFIDNLARKVRSFVIHRHNQAFDRQIGVEGGANPVNRIHQLPKPLECEVFTLDRDQYRVGGDQRINRQKAQRRGTIDQNVLKIVSNWIQQLL